MAQEHQEEDSVDPATHSMRRKCGRTWKNDIPGSEPYNRTRRRKVDVEAHENDPFVGQVVSGIFDGKFDAGYMLTVRIGETGSVLRGVVFEPGLSVPVSAANDIAPNVKMFKRDEVSLRSSRKRPCPSLIQSRKDGATRHEQRNESAMSSKGICADSCKDCQMHSSVDIQRLPENDSNHASGNLKRDFRSAIGYDASKDGIQNLQSTDVSAERSGDIHVPEVGNPSIIASDSTKTFHLQLVVSEDKPIAKLSQTTSESKQAAISDGRCGFTSDNKANNLQEVISDIKLNTWISQSASEAKQTVETSDAGPFSTNDNNAACLHEVTSDAKPVTEVSQIKTSESTQSANTSDAGPVFVDGASEDSGKVLPLVTIQTSEHITGSVADAKLVIEVSLTKPSAFEQSADTSDTWPVFKNGASDDYGKVLPPVTVQTSEQLTERVADAKPVTEGFQTKTSISNLAAETSDSWPVFKNGDSDDSDKVLPPVTVQTSDQITERVANAKPVTESS